MERVVFYMAVLGFAALAALYKWKFPQFKGENGAGHLLARYAGCSFRRRLLADSEARRFWVLLSKAVPGCFVFPQVAVGSLLEVTGKNSKSMPGLSASFKKPTLDFVVCDRQLNVLVLIDLDGGLGREQAGVLDGRDEMLKGAGYKVVHFDARKAYAMEHITRALFS